MGLTDVASGDDELLAFMGRIGWFPGRNVDIEADLEAWGERGYIVADQVRDYMTECGGLEFEYPRHSAVGGAHSVYVSGARASLSIARQLVTGYEARVGYNLCPVGQSASGNLWLVMAPDGTTYAARDQFLARIAGDGYRALLSISTRARLVPLS